MSWVLDPEVARRRRLRIARGRTRAVLAALAVLASTSSARATPLISELFYDAVGSDNGLSFVEIWGPPGTSLDGFTLEGVNGSGGAIGPVIVLGGVIPLDGFFVVADVDGDGATGVPNSDWLVNFDFQNGPDSVVLRDAVGGVDAIGYGSFGSGDVFAGEGDAAPDAPAGASLARHFADVDSDDNATDFGLLMDPTPGTGPLQAVPEPAATSLLAGSLIAMAAVRRRRPA